MTCQGGQVATSVSYHGTTEPGGIPEHGNTPGPIGHAASPQEVAYRCDESLRPTLTTNPPPEGGAQYDHPTLEALVLVHELPHEARYQLANYTGLLGNAITSLENAQAALGRVEQVDDTVAMDFTNHHSALAMCLNQLRLLVLSGNGTLQIEAHRSLELA